MGMPTSIASHRFMPVSSVKIAIAYAPTAMNPTCPKFRIPVVPMLSWRPTAKIP